MFYATFANAGRTRPCRRGKSWNACGPSSDSPMKLPLDDEELEKIHTTLPDFVALRKSTARGQASTSDHLDRVKALLLVLEHTGLRIIDAVQLNSRQSLKNRLELRAEKNQGDINLPLPPEVERELDILDRYRGDLYFWTGDGKPETAAGNYRRTLRALGDFCKVPDLHPHRFRDTFAVRLLLGGATLDCVARALSSITAWEIRRYQMKRLETVGPKTVNNELLVLTAILKNARLWAPLRETYQPLAVPKGGPGQARLASFKIEVTAFGLDDRHQAGILRAVRACLIQNALLGAPSIEIAVNAAAQVLV